ncbi:unnamed protein product, partial [marine sediment metagenome]
GIAYNLLDNDYIIDLGINITEVNNDDKSDYHNVGRITDQGDLSTYYGYETLDASGFTI